MWLVVRCLYFEVVWADNYSKGYPIHEVSSLDVLGLLDCWNLLLAICLCSCCPYSGGELLLIFLLSLDELVARFSLLCASSQVLRDGVLYFLPNIADPNYNFFHRTISCPFHKHVYSLLLNVAVHGSLIVMLVLVPIKFVILCAPSVLPINIRLVAWFLLSMDFNQYFILFN